MSFFKDGGLKGSYYNPTLIFVYSLTLVEVMTILEEDESAEKEIDAVVIFPPIQRGDVVTDEESGEEDDCNVNHLPGTQLRSEAEVILNNEEDVPVGDERDEEIVSPNNAVPESNGNHAAIINDRNRCKSPIHAKKQYVWRDGDLESQTIDWPNVYSVNNELSPLDMFMALFDEEIIDLLVTHTNRYAARRNRLGDVSDGEMRAFIGILLLSGYNTVSRRRMYWEGSTDSHNDLVANSMSRNRFDFIMSNFHCCDNEELNIDDKFSKVQPLFSLLNKKFQEFSPHHEKHSVDEAMVPYFGRHGCKQFIRGKPIRFGFKLWVGATNTGYVNWMEPYQGAHSNIPIQYKKEFSLGPAVVLRYIDVLATLGPYPYHVFFDNYFTTIPLLDELNARGVRGTGTIRENRMSACPIKTKVYLQKQDRGSFDFKTTANKDIVITKWNDNNVVSVASNAAPVFPLQTARRYSNKYKKIITVSQPRMIQVYNSGMGGVDRADQNISLYRISIRGKKWYFPLICHCIDVCEQNAWQLHKLNKGKMDHLGFRRRVAISLLESSVRTTPAKRCRPSPLENVDSRYDRIDHVIQSQGKQTRCRICHNKASMKCTKCNVTLHTKCFAQYHTKM